MPRSRWRNFSISTSHRSFRAELKPGDRAIIYYVLFSLSLCSLDSEKILKMLLEIESYKIYSKWLPWTVDHLARGSMKNAANCASTCELQDTWTSTFRTHIAVHGLMSRTTSGWGSFNNRNQTACVQTEAKNERSLNPGEISIFGVALNYIHYYY